LIKRRITPQVDVLREFARELQVVIDAYALDGFSPSARIRLFT